MKYMNERGYALFLTIAVITLISVIALGLITVTANSQKTTVDERYDQSLFYIAESGISLEKAKISKIIDKLHTEAISKLNEPRTQKEFQNFIAPYGDVKRFYKSYIEGNFCSSYGEIVDVNNCSNNGAITITNQYDHYNPQFNKKPITSTKTSGSCKDLESDVSCSFEILSSAKHVEEPKKIRSLKQTLKIDFNTTPTIDDTVTQVDTISDVPLKSLAALITGDIVVNGNAHLVKGNIASSHSLENVNFTEGFKGFKINEDINLNTLLPVKPTLLESATNLDKIDQKTTLSGDVKLPKLEKDTVIYIGDNDVNLFVDEADLTGVKIVGTGKINIIILGDEINIGGKFNESGNSNKTTIFYEGSFSKINSDSVINASLYSSTIPAFTGKGNLDVKGNIYHPYTEPLTLSGNSSIKANAWIAPNASIELKGGGNVDNFIGTIMAKELLISGNIDLVAGSNVTIPTSSYKYGGNNDTVKESSLVEI